MKIKKGVNTLGLNLKMRIVRVEVERIWKELNQEAVITAAVEDNHSAGSYHPYGYALDFRTRYFTKDEKEKAYSELKKRMKKYSLYYDVVMEKTHIHIEFDYDRWVALQ